jgi:hypothetical protein
LFLSMETHTLHFHCHALKKQNPHVVCQQ